MANPKHVELLLSGVDKWNAWREEDEWETRPELSEADLSFAKLSVVDLSEADLSETDLSGAYLEGAKLSFAKLSHANLSGAFLGGAYLSFAKLSGADLSHAKLSQADLSHANLHDANLRAARLDGAKLSDARCWDTTWSDINLTTCIGLDTIQHRGPSSLDHRTLHKSPGLPEVFLRGCGLSDLDIAQYRILDPSLKNTDIAELLDGIYVLRANSQIQTRPVFISYNHKDAPFAEKLEDALQGKGVRCWRDHKMTAGPIEEQIERAIEDRTVLVILSKHSINSDWVQSEVRSGRDRAIATNRHVLCPIALDSTWATCQWPKRVMQQIKKYKVLDFAQWQDPNAFEKKLGLLLEGLDIYYVDLDA